MSENGQPPDDSSPPIDPFGETQPSAPSESSQDATRTTVAPPPLEPTTVIHRPEPPAQGEATRILQPESEPTRFTEYPSQTHVPSGVTTVSPPTEAPQDSSDATRVTTYTEPAVNVGEATKIHEPAIGALGAPEPTVVTKPLPFTPISASTVAEPTDWKGRLAAFGKKITSSAWFKDFGTKLQNFEPAQAAEWANKRFQKQKSGFYGKALTIALCAFFLADLSALLVGRFIPEPPVSHPSRSGNGYRRAKMVDDYGIIFTRNLFNSQGIIPGESGGSQTSPDMNNVPVRTSLPLNLIGTVILQDELRSIATIEDKSASQVYPVRETDEIPSKLKVVKVEARKVTFVNVSSGRLEFVDLPEDANAPPTTPKVTPGRGGGPGIEKVAPNQFNVNRSEVDKALQDLNKVLTEARAVPNFENGVANGYKLFQIVPGSIYDKLGLQNGDVILGLNGTPINDPGKAFEMLSELKTSNHLELQVKKDGKVQNNTYDIR